MAEVITNSEYQDIETNIIDDIIPERILRVYPYELVNVSISEAFIKENSVSFATISQSGLDDSKPNIKVDENGYKYFEVFTAITSSTQLDIASVNSVFGQEIKEEESLFCLSNWYYEGTLEPMKIGTTSFVPALFTVGKPYSLIDYKKDEQTVFMASSSTEAKAGELAMDKGLSPEGLYEFSLVNIKVLEASFVNSRVIPLPGTKSTNTTPITDITLSGDGSMLLNRVFGRGRNTIDDSIETFDLVLKDGLLPMKGTPTETQGKLSMFFDWFDYDVVMPQYIAQHFNVSGGVRLSTLKNVDFRKTGHTTKFFDDDQLGLLQDVILVSYLFATNFSEPGYRYTAQEAKSNGGGSKPGDIKAELLIGNSSLSMVSIANKDPIKVIDNIYETYLRKHPNQEDSTQYLAIKEITAAASRYIYSSYAIGKGQNAFNQILLPWYIQPLDGIQVLSISNNRVKLSDNTKWILRSEWFDLSNFAVEAKTNETISQIRLKQTDRKLTIPTIPEVISPIDKLSLPGDMDTKSSKDLRYFWFLPYSSEQNISTIMLGTPTASSGSSPNRTFNTEWTRYGEGIVNQHNFVLSQASKIFNQPQSNFNVVSTGTLEQRSIRVNSVRDVNQGRRASYRGVDMITSYSGPGGVSGWNRATASRQLLEKIASVESSYRGYVVSVDDIELVDMECDFYHYYNDGFRFTDGSVYHLGSWDSRIKFASGQPREIQSSGSLSSTLVPKSFGVILKSERLANAVVHSSAQVVSFDIDREALFDKHTWSKFIGNFSIPVNDINLKLADDSNIKYITELEISSIWANNISIDIGTETYDISMFNKDNEALGIQRILFT